jgi:hypothetical protein
MEETILLSTIQYNIAALLQPIRSYVQRTKKTAYRSYYQTEFEQWILVPVAFVSFHALNLETTLSSKHSNELLRKI